MPDRIAQYLHVAKRVRDYVQDHHLRPGDRLPAEREFAALFDCGRPTVNKALACLIAESLLRRDGYKLYVAHTPLAEKRVAAIAVLCPHPLHQKKRVTHNMVEAAHDVCALSRTRFTPMLSTDGPDQQAQLQALLREPPDGLVMWPHADHAYGDILQQYAARSIPIVLNDLPVGDSLDFVGVDNFQGISAILNHLWDNGHREIAYCTRKIFNSNLRERMDSFQFLVANRFKGAALPEIYKVAEDDREMESVLKKLLRKDRKITAVCCSHDTIALDLMRSCRRAGLEIPEQLSIAGFDGIDSSETSVPSLTTVAQDFYQLGALAVDLLLRRIHLKQLRQPLVPQRIHLAPRLLCRESTARLPEAKKATSRQT